MSEQHADAKALKVAKELKSAHNWKHLARWHGAGYYELQTEDTGDVPVRLFLTPTLLANAEDILYRYTLHSNSSILIINNLGTRFLAGKSQKISSNICC